MKQTYLTYIAILGLFMCKSTFGNYSEDFNTLADGPIHTQPGWWSDHPENATNAFVIMDYLGFTQKEGDKAFIVSKSENYVKVVNDQSVAWEPGSTATLEMDMQVGLSGGHVAAAQNGIAVLLGGKELQQGKRWVISLGILPDGKWVLRGNAPHWENINAMPPDTILQRPEEGQSAVSDWFHIKVTSTKSETKNVFETRVVLSDKDGKTMLDHAFRKDPITDATAEMWAMDTLSFGFSAHDDINGVVCVDNLELTSVAKPKEIKGLGDLLK